MSGGIDPLAAQQPARRDLGIALLLLLAGFSVYLANFRLISSSDNYPARYLPFSILKHGSLYLDPIEEITAQGDAHPYWILHRYGHAVSTYPVVVPLLLTPLYAPAVAWLDIRGWTQERFNAAARVMEKCCAALVASISVALMYLLLRRRAGVGAAALLAVAYAFGTNTWMIGSQALWQHGVGELLLVTALYLVTGACTKKRALAAGFICGLIASNRPPDVLLAVMLGVYALLWAGNGKRLVVLGAIAPLALLLVYNLCVVHTLVGGYARRGNIGTFHCDLLAGLAGLLFSPARGLFIFTPFLLFLPLGIKAVMADRKFRSLDLFLIAGIILLLVCYAKIDWRAGCSWGPRWLTEVLPLMTWMLAPVLLCAGPVRRAMFLAAVCFSIAVQVVGAFWYTGKSDEIIMPGAGDPGYMRNVWDIRNTPYLVELQHKPAPMGLLYETAGCVDHVQVNGRDTNLIPIGAEVRVEGWSLTNRRTPGAVIVALWPVGNTLWRGPDYYPVTRTEKFEQRPDVTETMHATGPSGWNVKLRTDGFDPGKHVLQVCARDGTLGEFHPVTRVQVTLVKNEDHPDGLPAAASDVDTGAKEAVKLLQAGQQLGGYWLTDYTQTGRFVHPAKEMNTFLTSMMIDLLQPVAAEAGLQDALDRARTHLAAQVESSGLVRYHGHPDFPDLPALGRVITPDADDTTLVWRIAGKGRESLLPQVLGVLKSYETPEGLFRTWLARADQYVSIDPGKDPNPTDIGIQMHVLMFLDGVDKQAAGKLFNALQSAVNDDSKWVYYKKTPLVPLLRQGDLRNLGYTLTLPPARMEAAVQDQAVWVTICRWIAQTSDDKADTTAGALPLLKRLAADHFAEIRKNPPLMYHNDLTARVGRFYWSEDFGYALWLRLYFQCRGKEALNSTK